MQIFFGLLLVCFCFPVYAQNSIDINADTKNLQAQESAHAWVRKMFNDVDRYRTFDYNKQLASLNMNNVGDTLLLNFFDDKQYKSVIQQVSTTLKGRTSITSKIADAEFAYCYMVVSATTISISADLPQEDEHFFASVKNGQAYISQIKKSELDKTALAGSDVMIPLPHQKSQYREIKDESKGIDDDVIIDVLFVYTPAAEQWALYDGMVTDIHDLINLALQLSNTAMENSNTGVTFNIVYEHLTDYVETDTSEDLYRITDPYDGYMDEVHVLRDFYYADEIVFLPEVSFTGGVAWLLNDENGFDPDYYAVALCRVQQSSWTYTVVHEVGHNMGCNHNAEQNFQPGPGLFDYSSGWRGIINGERRCTVMTYEDGSYFDDEQTHTRIPYFSSPDIMVDGVIIGDAETADNVLTIKRTKTAVANYRIPPDGPLLIVNPLSLNFGNVFCGTTSTVKNISVSGKDLLENITYTVSGADETSFDITQVSWNPATGGTLGVTFSPTEAKNHNATITFTSQDAQNKTVTLSGTGTLSTYTITATAGANGTITPAGIIPVSLGDDQQFTFVANPYYAVNQVLVDGVNRPDSVAGGSYTFKNITSDHTIEVIFGGYTVTVSANPPAGGTVSGGGSDYLYGTPITVSAVPNAGYKFVNWTENSVEVSKNTNYSFTVAENRNLLANFEKEMYEVIVLIDDEEHGFTEGSGMYDANSTVQVEFFPTCYRFKNWTINGVPVSTANPYEFVVKENVTIVANFYILDFDTYCPTLWNNTFMLNMKKLRADGYGVIGCRWFKNDIEETDTRTLSEFSYSAGPNARDLLEAAPTYYSFRLITLNSGEICSTLKHIRFNVASPANKIWTYPNPVTSGIPFTVEGVAKDDEVRVYNQYGNCVHTAIASGETITLTLNVQAGVYVVKAEKKQVKVVVIR